jgi:hypothetical protein
MEDVMERDMSFAQFRAALSRNSMILEGFMGYVRMPGAGHRCVSYLNAPRDTWRSRLAYLLQQKEKYEAEIAKVSA